MGTELVKTAPGSLAVGNGKAVLPELVERAGGAARFAWDESFYAEHHNPHTQKAYMAAVQRFLGWCEGQGLELPGVTPGMVGQYLVGLGGSPSKRNLHLSALRGFFDRLVNRHVVILNPAASVRGVKDEVVEGKTPEITIEQARTLLASVDTGHIVGLRDRAILATLAYTACRAGAVAKLRLQDAGLQLRLSPHSFRVTAITDLLTQGVPLEDVQYLAGHAEPRTTGLYDRRQKKVTRNIVERISI